MAYLQIRKRFYRVFVIFFIATLLFLFSAWVSKTWPAETGSAGEEKEIPVAESVAPEDYVAIMEQAENWPVIEHGWDSRFYIKLHQDPENLDRVMLTEWFVNKNNNYQLEMFAKMLYLKSTHKSGGWFNALAATLKDEDGVWKVGDYYRSMSARRNDKDVIAFRLFKRHGPSNSMMIRVFYYENTPIMPPMQ